MSANPRLIVALFLVSFSSIACGDGVPGTAVDGTSCTDTLMCTAPPTNACVDDSTFRAFADSGVCTDERVCEYEFEDTTCGPLGCCDDGCCQLTPSNSDVVGSLRQTGLVIGAPSGSFNTVDDCHSDSPLGECGTVDNEDESYCVCRMDQLTISDLVVVGDAALVVLAHESVTVTGSLTASANEATNGPGANRRYTDPSTSLVGGGGGSYASSGGNEPAAPGFGNAGLVPLLGGMRGQDACNSRPGGGGGGAVQISAGIEIVVVGSVSAGGGGGAQGFGGAGVCLGGAGGGSGGALLFEAPVVDISGTVTANGGSGGGGGNNDGISGTAGNNALAAASRAPGGTATDVVCTIGGTAVGGDGGAGSVGSESGVGGQASAQVDCFSGVFRIGGGGGGGGAGRVRVNSSSGCLCTGVFSPSPSFGSLTP